MKVAYWGGTVEAGIKQTFGFREKKTMGGSGGRALIFHKDSCRLQSKF